MLPKLSKSQKGFTLIEILVVIGILAILLTIVLVAVNPGQNTKDARNTKRRSDVLNILNAVNQYYVAQGVFPPNTPDDGELPVAISFAEAGAGFCNALVPTYIAALPGDPTTGASTNCSGTSWDTSYTISQGAASRITVSAPDAEGATISATR